MTNRPYRTIFCADLVQDSAMSIGGRTGLNDEVDDVFCRDGNGNVVLRGEGLAGALVATANRIFGRVPSFISSRPGAADGLSLWMLHTSHPIGMPRLEVRRSVGLRHDTGARAEGVLFDVETSPRQTRWTFMLEVDTFEGGTAIDGAVAEYMAAQSLLEWERGRCWLGRSVARGLGWGHLEKLRAWRLETDFAECWPDNRGPARQIIETLGVASVPSKSFNEEFPKPASGVPSIDRPWYYLELRGTVRVGAQTGSDSYGIDGLAVGGQEAPIADDVLLSHFMRPRSIKENAFVESFDPDMCFALTRNPSNAEVEPFLPGSGIRGPLRHGFSRDLRMKGETVRDPNVERRPRGTPDQADLLFGSTARSARMLVMDAYLSPGSAWEAACLKQHAENEFTSGVYGSGLYERAILTEATFDLRAVIEFQEDPALIEAMSKTLADVLELGRVGHLPLGAGKWRVAGWPVWRIDQLRWGPAGEPADADLIRSLADISSLHEVA